MFNNLNYISHIYFIVIWLTSITGLCIVCNSFKTHDREVNDVKIREEFYRILKDKNE